MTFPRPQIISFSIAALALVLVGSIAWVLPPTHAQSTSAAVTCTPVQQFTQTRTQLECRVSAGQSNFVVAEVNFPFHISSVLRASSPYSSSLSLPYPVGTVSSTSKTTLVTAATSWGDRNTSARLQSIPFDGLSYLIETNQSMSQLKALSATEQVHIDYLIPNLSNPQEPIFNSLDLDLVLQFDQTLVLESFTQYNAPSIIQFLRLAAACYLQTPDVCVQNLIDNL